MGQRSWTSRRLQVALGDYGFHNKTEDWLANWPSWVLSYGALDGAQTNPTPPGDASLLR